MKTLAKVFKDNGLSLAFGALFLVCLIGQAVSGYALEREEPALQPHAQSLVTYLGSAAFLRGVFGNWQAALLQLATLIVFAVFLRQRGASHSRKPDDEKPSADQGYSGKGPIGWTRHWLYRNSLSLAFLAMFVVAFAVFVIADWHSYQSERQTIHLGAIGIGRFLISARLWFDVMQTWQAEFFAMAVFLVLSIFLRQENSAESKPVWARDDDTGETNE